MASSSRINQAFMATRALGIPDEEVKPLLKQLLKVYDKNWELIEEDNYRTLLDAYFELKENKGVEDKSRIKGDAEHKRSDKPSKRLHVAEQENQTSSIMDEPSRALDLEESEMPQTTSKLEIKDRSQPCLADSRTDSGSQLIRSKFTDKGKQPILSHVPSGCRKSNSKKPLSAQEQANKPSCICIERENMSSKVQRRELIKPKAEQPVAGLPLSGKPISMTNSGLPRSSEKSNGDRSVKPLISKYENMHKKDVCSAHNYNGNCKTNLNIASSPLGEVKILLNCDSALGQRNFQIPRFDEVLNFVEDKYIRSYKIVKPQFSVMKLLKDLYSSKYSSEHNLEFHSKSFNHNGKRPSQYLDDITKGSEKVKISLTNEFGNEHLPKFNYIPHNVIYQNANVNISLARIVDEDCCSSCSGDCLSSSIPCACARETGGEFAYTQQGLLREDFLRACLSMKKDPQEHHFVYCQDCPIERSNNESMPEQCKGHLVRKFIKECWRKCGCDMQCGNRVVQRGITCKLQVFLTCEGKGWGLRTLEVLPKGTFVCEYVGEVLTNLELYDRNLKSSGNERHTYPVTLDADWGSEGILRDEEALCLDATFHGNVARFINHRCSDGNLVEIPVEVETPDRHYYHLAFFTTRQVSAMEELTWDYGIDFDDRSHPVKAFRCRCKSSFCRDKKRKRK
ncbi:probable inactive histone-lysine N-methyltransferase SUVR1 isoform X4 [Ziziphus jujuba]|uniref:Probable inactive histone-lysine N-methyltransferase SUVR1 isoform X4 n=1 Tax=Ziziphus jujuba TaxID=326968 RepID=A0ABM3IB47_ZIZJJ|nr:probable inactive histone-lysine N-methyltransferase SUVR1 isoform X4 [Ziziphus jujuba]